MLIKVKNVLAKLKKKIFEMPNLFNLIQLKLPSFL
jgi:hypothetical protein